MQTRNITPKHSCYIKNAVPKGKTVSFKGKLPDEILKEVNQTSRLKKLISKTSIKLGLADDEKMANVANAAGKIAIAPFVIAFNPISKEKKDTKVYTAWKQPIEGVTTIAIQLLALKQLDKIMDKLAEKGKLGEHFDTGIKDSKILEINKEKLGVFKSRAGFFVALAMVPVTTSLVNWAYPKIMNKILPQIDTSKVKEN